MDAGESVTEWEALSFLSVFTLVLCRFSKKRNIQLPYFKPACTARIYLLQCLQPISDLHNSTIYSECNF